jgi:hypothetical protein
MVEAFLEVIEDADQYQWAYQSQYNEGYAESFRVD